jgi:hypothetical protein
MLSLARSRVLVAINRHCRSLRYDKNNIIVVIASCDTTLSIDHCILMMLLALQCISLRALRAFAIIARSLAMRYKNLVGCCVARSRAPLMQSTIVVIASCNMTYQGTLVAVILAINSVRNV